MRRYIRSWMEILLVLAVWTTAKGGEDTVSVSPALADDHGVLTHTVRSPFQAGSTEIRVLLPSDPKPGARFPVVYVLPVEAENNQRYGDGLLEVKKLGLHNKHRAIFVAPTFSQLPWYADHPTDPAIRQETYFLKVVVPFVERTYPVAEGIENRMLLGFSKSGWGAWSLLLRHPDQFGRAAAWDAPMRMDGISKYGAGDVFGTKLNLEQYEISRLLRDRAKVLGESPRLILTGYGNFREDHVQVHNFMIDNKIAHEYRDGPYRKHDWHSGWVAEAVELLIKHRSAAVGR